MQLLLCLCLRISTRSAWTSQYHAWRTSTDPFLRISLFVFDLGILGLRRRFGLRQFFGFVLHKLKEALVARRVVALPASRSDVKCPRAAPRSRCASYTPFCFSYPAYLKRRAASWNLPVIERRR
jgi:hypothetical protein